MAEHADIPTRDYEAILKEHWGYDAFRGIQRNIIESIADRKEDTLGLMPTGGGKSVTFQVPALAMEGVCIVITPLIALMRDQVNNLLKRDIRAACIYSGMSRQNILKTLDNCILGSTKLLYVSPERIDTAIFKTKLAHMKVSFITVDEAHCISQWGYDFRPSYLKIADIRKIKPDVPVLALTATATESVINDIQRQLGFKKQNVHSMSFERKNLAYVVRYAEDKQTELTHILKSLPASAIVYVRSRKRAKELCEFLCEQDIKATFYHAGLETEYRDDRQRTWTEGKHRVMVATNAFGMGIDKADVRIVVHYDCPSSLEEYFQEAGRAGRDGKKAYAVLLFNDSDPDRLRKNLEVNYPDKEFIKTIYEELGSFFQMAVGDGYGVTNAFDITKFCIAFRRFPLHVDAALKILDQAGYIEYETDPGSASRLKFLLEREELYRLRQVSPREEEVITALLRNYGTLFIDYTYIDLTLLEIFAKMPAQDIYQILKGLSQRGILHFIPQRSTPYITYRQRRVDTEDVIIRKEVYEDRKKEAEKRMRAMVEYATDDNTCRSVQLLAYFGERRANDCKQCDICLEKFTDQESKERIKPVAEGIVKFLSDCERHHVTELHNIHFPTRQFDAALHYLLYEGIVKVEGNYVYLSKDF